MEDYYTTDTWSFLSDWQEVTYLFTEHTTTDD